MIKHRFVAVVALFIAVSGLGPARSTPPDSQTQTWRILKPSCQATESWALLPSARNANLLHVEGRMVCADPNQEFLVSLSLLDVNQTTLKGYVQGPLTSKGSE